MRPVPVPAASAGFADGVEPDEGHPDASGQDVSVEKGDRPREDSAFDRREGRRTPGKTGNPRPAARAGGAARAGSGGTLELGVRN